MNSSRRRLDSLSDKYTTIASNGLRVIKRTSEGVTLAWPEKDSDIVTITDSNVSCLDLNTDLDSEGSWFIVQMRKMDEDVPDWNTVYKGYGQRCEVHELDPNSVVLFRLKRNGDKQWGTEIVASTDPPPVSGEDLNRAVEMSSEYMVTRILGNTPNSHLKKILALHDKNGMTSLMVACHNGNYTIAKMLLSCGSPVNDASTGVMRTSLMFACIVGKLNLVQLLDQYGCDWRPKDKSGCNAMHHAINGGNLAIVRMAFAKLGQQLAFEPDLCGWTPVMRAVISSDSLDIVKFLIGKGADPNQVDKSNSKSILMAAILSRKANFVNFLLEWGADPFYKNLNGKNCYDLACGLGYKDIATMIRQKMETLQPSLPKPSNFVFSSYSNNNNNEESRASIYSRSLASKKSNQRNSSASVSTEVTDTLESNDDFVNNDDRLPIGAPSNANNAIAKKRFQKRTEETPLHSVSSVLETKYLMLPHGKLQ